MCVFILQGLVNQFDSSERVAVVPPPRDIPMDMNSDFVKTLQPCDIVLYRFRGEKDIIGGVTAYITSSPYSHAEVVIENGYTISAASHGITFIDVFKQNLVNGHHLDIFRLNRLITREERIIIQGKALKTIAMPYDYANLVLFPFIGKKKAIQLSGNLAYMCSEHVAWCYDNASISLITGRPTAIDSPADLGRSNVLNYIGTFVDGKKVAGDFRNEFTDEKFSAATQIIANIMGLASNKDEYYKGLYLNKTLLEGKA
jgi:hypothetical protein